jgi:hypothetical protein
LAKGETQQVRRRKPLDAKRLAKRVGEFCACDAPVTPEGVQRLNPGFFTLERMRQSNVTATKERAKKRGKVRGK